MPLSNLELKVVQDLKDHPIVKMMDANLLVTVNSGRSGIFGGYMDENYVGLAKALELTKSQIARLVKNSFTSSWLSDPEKEKILLTIDEYVTSF